MDVDGGVDIPVMVGATIRAYPRAHGKVLHLGVLFSAARANLARREELPDSDEYFSVTLRLIGELPKEFTPCGIPDALCQLMIFHHVLGRETLHADDVILPHNLSRELLLVVPSHVSDMLLKTGDPQASLLTVPASLLLSGKLPLKASELLLTLGEVLGVFVFISIAGDNEIFDTEVQTNGCSCGLPEFLWDTSLQWMDTKYLPLGSLVMVAEVILPLIFLDTLHFTNPSLGSLTALSNASMDSFTQTER